MPKITHGLHMLQETGNVFCLGDCNCALIWEERMTWKSKRRSPTIGNETCDIHMGPLSTAEMLESSNSPVCMYIGGAVSGLVVKWAPLKILKLHRMHVGLEQSSQHCCCMNIK